MTLFSFEVPLAHLQDFDDLQDYYFCLSFLTQHEEYNAFMRNVKDKKVIMDNSWNELKRAQTPEEVYRAVERTHATHAICPDDPSWGLEDLVKAFEEMSKYMNSNRLFVVPRNNKEFRHFRNVLKVRGMAIPYRSRPYFPAYLPWGTTHFLGLRDPMEIKMCDPYSCDTSMPIKLALKGITMDEWIVDSCPHIETVPSFFEVKMTQGEIMLARDNIKRLKEVCTW